MNGLMAVIQNLNINDQKASNAMFLAALTSVKKKYKFNKELLRLGIGTNDIEMSVKKSMYLLSEKEKRCCICKVIKARMRENMNQHRKFKYDSECRWG